MNKTKGSKVNTKINKRIYSIITKMSKNIAHMNKITA